jgi:uncharacterized protein (TIGR03067 family)
MKVHSLFVLTGGLLFAAGALPANASDNDREKLQGTWVAVSGEANGQQAPQEAVRGFKMFVRGDRITFTPETDQRESSFKLDPSQHPKAIVITPLDGPRKGRPQRGLYSFEKGYLKLCVNNEKEQSPIEFATKPGDGLRLLVLKRQRP